MYSTKGLSANCAMTEFSDDRMARFGSDAQATTPAGGHGFKFTATIKSILAALMFPLV
jgi:hypothetical protein